MATVWNPMDQTVGTKAVVCDGFHSVFLTLSINTVSSYWACTNIYLVQ